MSPYQFIAAIITPLQSKYAKNLIINAVTTAKVWKARGQKNVACAKKDFMKLHIKERTMFGYWESNIARGTTDPGYSPVAVGVAQVITHPDNIKAL